MPDCGRRQHRGRSRTEPDAAAHETWRGLAAEADPEVRVLADLIPSHAAYSSARFTHETPHECSLTAQRRGAQSASSLGRPPGRVERSARALRGQSSRRPACMKARRHPRASKGRHQSKERERPSVGTDGRELARGSFVAGGEERAPGQSGCSLRPAFVSALPFVPSGGPIPFHPRLLAVCSLVDLPISAGHARASLRGVATADARAGELPRLRTHTSKRGDKKRRASGGGGGGGAGGGVARAVAVSDWWGGGGKVHRGCRTTAVFRWRCGDGGR